MPRPEDKPDLPEEVEIHQPEPSSAPQSGGTPPPPPPGPPKPPGVDPG
jgi:hypothetical protein